MTSTKRDFACSLSTAQPLPNRLHQAASLKADYVGRHERHTHGRSAEPTPISAEDLACPTNHPLNQKSDHQDPSNAAHGIHGTEGSDIGSSQARRLLRQNTRLVSTFHRAASHLDPAPATQSPHDPDCISGASAASMQQTHLTQPPGIGRQATTEPNELEQYAEKDVQVPRAIANLCSVPMAKLKSISDCSSLSPAVMEMVKATRRQSLEIRALHHSASSAAFRSCSLPVDDSSSIPQRLLDVEVYSLGMFAFKGLAAHRQIAQLMPSSLSERLALFPHALKRGKATCVTPDNKLLAVTTVVLPDVSGLTLAR